MNNFPIFRDSSSHSACPMSRDLPTANSTSIAVPNPICKTSEEPAVKK